MLHFVTGELAGRQSGCLTCPGGSICGAGTITPVDCGTGKYTPDGDTTCITCEVGQVNVDNYTA